jgi:hypothetical protein
MKLVTKAGIRGWRRVGRVCLLVLVCVIHAAADLRHHQGARGANLISQRDDMK